MHICKILESILISYVIIEIIIEPNLYNMKHINMFCNKDIANENYHVANSQKVYWPEKLLKNSYKYDSCELNSKFDIMSLKMWAERILNKFLKILLFLNQQNIFFKFVDHPFFFVNFFLFIKYN